MNYIQVFNTFKDLLENLFNILQSEYPGASNVIDIEFDDFTMKTNLLVRDGIIGKRFDEKSFLSGMRCFQPHSDYKHYNKYNSQRIVNLSVANKIHLKCNVIDGSVVSGLRQPILYSFVLDKQTGYKVFSDSATFLYKKIDKSVLNTINFYLENDNHEEVDFNAEPLTFSIQLNKIEIGNSLFQKV